ncbi:MAG: hypothetical protein HeimC2_42500 [Candidatus Heimdallarchaeota archaeon LC_2]|nr:MAG: hypothetical protein HeimC2_42500 [Candidatus Heimdallarchaeota archaeon LC_2]
MWFTSFVYVRTYTELLKNANNYHKDFLKKYERLQRRKTIEEKYYT